MDKQYIEQAEAKLLVLMEGLAIQRMEEFLKRAKIGDYRKLGEMYYERAKEGGSLNMTKQKLKLILPERPEKHGKRNFALSCIAAVVICYGPLILLHLLTR